MLHIFISLMLHNQNPYIEEEQTTQWPKEKVQKDKQRYTKHTYKAKDRVTRTPLKTGGDLRCSGRVAVPAPLVRCKIPTTPAYGVCISQLIRHSRSCGSYHDFLDRWLLLTRKLQNQWFLLVKLNSSLRKFYGCNHDLVDRLHIKLKI
jgi:hypothetical protein